MHNYLNDWVLRLSGVAKKANTSPHLLMTWLLKDLGVSTNIRFLEPQTLTSHELNKIDACLNRLLNGEPISKIVQNKEFYGRTFKTTRDTLDPRYDSEILIYGIRKYFALDDSPHFLDLGTGTGCLLITLLCEFPHATGVAVECSREALDVARENARTHNVFDRIQFCLSDWCEKLTPQIFDGIISNPPYIADDYDLDPSVAQFDPPLSLFAGKDGLDAYRTLFEQLGPFCNSLTKVIVEIGYDQSETVPHIALKNDFRLIKANKDTNNIIRALVFEKNLKFDKNKE